MPFKKAKRKGIFKLNKNEKELLQLQREEKMLKKKEKRKELLRRFIQEEDQKEEHIKEKISNLRKALEQKGTMITEVPKEKSK